MADFNGQPFLEFLLKELSNQGIKRVVLSTGYMSDYIVQRIGNWQKFIDVELVVEHEQLGTGGAISYAMSKIHQEEFFVLNGDSFCKINVEHVISFHQRNQAKATLVATHMSDISSFGSVHVDDDAKIIKFSEKQGVKKQGLVNAGIYIFNKTLYNQFNHSTKFSLEYDVFPALIGNSFYCYVASSSLYDIGTPESYARALSELGE